jgi:hypothetical protein
MKLPRLLTLALALAPLSSFAWEVRSQSPKDMFLEFKLAPWSPALAPALITTYGSLPMLLGEVEFDYQVFQKFGTIAVGVSAGYAEKFAKAFVSGTEQRSGESTGLRVVPIKVLAIYRFDLTWLRWDVPLVPYIKGGVVGMPWWITKGADVESYLGKAGAGTRFGLVGVVGLSLTLDFLDRRLARDFDSSVGVNHSYLFAEFALQDLSLFNAASNTAPIDFSTKHFTFGLGFEF